MWEPSPTMTGVRRLWRPGTRCQRPPVEICSLWKPAPHWKRRWSLCKEGPRQERRGSFRVRFKKDAVLGSWKKIPAAGFLVRQQQDGAEFLCQLRKPGDSYGNAAILSNISGTEVREYSVEILKLYPGEKACGRNLLLHVTDPALLEATGELSRDEWVAHHTRWQTDWSGYPCVSQ